jgi:hypothetical protein
MPDNVPLGQWSGGDAMDRLRVAIENHQKATERQTTTTRWLNVVMTALTILMAVPTVVQVWRFAYSEFGLSFVSGVLGSFRAKRRGADTAFCVSCELG